uniref:Methyltransferase-like protein 17, mitochondrial n=2 Tax=Sarcoptes scabiei TaxID=52283 RepID=A0A834VET1_SARSC
MWKKQFSQLCYQSKNLGFEKLVVRQKHRFVLKELSPNPIDDNDPRRHPGNRRGLEYDLPYKLLLNSTKVINRYRNKNFRAKVKKINEEFLNVFVAEKNDNNSIPTRNTIHFDDSMDYLEFEKHKTHLKEEYRRNLYFEKDFYNAHDCASYMAARLPANYMAISYILNQIRKEEPDFVPTSVFDFGSGMGTTIWACDHYWKDSIREYFCVDINENMNELSRELLQNGTPNNAHILNQIFYRQFLPAKHIPSYDLVVSAFSLMELEHTSSRLYALENLWQKTSGALVVIEHGSKSGFNLVMEARNFLLQISKAQLEAASLKPKNVPNKDVSNRQTESKGSIMAPCPHNHICPRQSILNKKSYCNFAVNYQQLDYGQMNPGIKSEKFAYFVMKKNGYFDWREEQKIWSRIVEPVVKRSKHSICRICDNDGCLKEIIVARSKYPQNIYRCIKTSRWGDRIPAMVCEAD